MVKGGLLADKERMEKDFVKWIDADAARKAKYGDVIPAINALTRRAREDARAQRAPHGARCGRHGSARRSAPADPLPLLDREGEEGRRPRPGVPGAQLDPPARVAGARPAHARPEGRPRAHGYALADVAKLRPDAADRRPRQGDRPEAGHSGGRRRQGDRRVAGQDDRGHEDLRQGLPDVALRQVDVGPRRDEGLDGDARGRALPAAGGEPREEQGARGRDLPPRAALRRGAPREERRPRLARRELHAPRHVRQGPRRSGA